MQLNYKYLEELLQETMKVASKAILEIYEQSDLEVHLKKDKSPLTCADITSNEVIIQALSETQLPIFSEESEHVSYQERMQWDAYWLIDPLDGTREFIQRSGEFTINIALIEQNTPTLGAVCIPTEQVTYIGGTSLGYTKKYYKHEVFETKPRLTTHFEDLFAYDQLKTVASKSDNHQGLSDFVNRTPSNTIHFKGSSLKFMALVDHEADIYPRFTPCMEWDTAASDAILRSVGRSILALDKHNLPTGRIEYNKEDLYQPPFVAF